MAGRRQRLRRALAVPVCASLFSTKDRSKLTGTSGGHLRSVIIILGGLALLGLLALLGTQFGGGLSMVTAAQTFIPVWFVAMLVNIWLGVSRAGYSVAEEFPVFLVTFAVPAAAAAFVWWKFS